LVEAWQDIERVEGWKVGRLEGWKVGKLKVEGSTFLESLITFNLLTY
jgi:hypothetical protein